MSRRVSFRLAQIPDFAEEEYHHQQVALYAAYAELTFEALNLRTVLSYFERLSKKLRVKNVSIRIMRMPASKSMNYLVYRNGKHRLVKKRLKGRHNRRTGVIDIFPYLFWPRRKSKPFASVGIRGHFLNGTLRTVIHEMLHKSGLREEEEVRTLADQYANAFRKACLEQFDKEFKPILKKWKQTEKKLGLRWSIAGSTKVGQGRRNEGLQDPICDRASCSSFRRSHSHHTHDC